MSKYFSDKLNFTSAFFLVGVLMGIMWHGFLVDNASAQTQSLPVEPLTIITQKGSFDFNVEIADEAQERTIGLMNREKMDARAGMLFVFDQKSVITMWMKNTILSLDMVFINEKGVVETVAKRTTPQSLNIVTSIVPVGYVLELNAGMADFIGITKGSKIVHLAFETQSPVSKD